MNLEFVQPSRFLSNIINNNLNIDYDDVEPLGFLTNSVHQNQNLYPNQNQSCINPVPQNQEKLFDTFFEQILAKCSTETNASVDQNNFWVGQDDILGTINRSSISQKIQTAQLPSKKTRKIKKRKTIFKSKPSKKFKKRQSKQALQKRLQLEHKLRSETKNIPKNYGKAIIGFILKDHNKVRHIKGYESVNFEELKRELKEIKKNIKTIADLRSLWIDCKHARLIRILGNRFLRERSLTYIFNSKIESTDAHVKYRSKLLRAIKNPESFQCIKGL